MPTAEPPMADPLDQVRILLARVSSARVRQRVEKSLVLWELGYVREALSQFRVTSEETLRRLLPLCPEAEVAALEQALDRGRTASVIERLHHELEVIPARVGLQLHTLLAWGNYASHHQKRGHQARGADLLVLVSIAVDLEDWMARQGHGGKPMLAPDQPTREHGAPPRDQAVGMELVIQLLGQRVGVRLHQERHRLVIPDLSLELYWGRPELAPAPEEPYRGLRSFEVEDAGRFYGRGRLVGELEQSVDTRRLTVLSGASGAGKTSLLRAGLLPLLLDLGCGVVCLTDYSEEAVALLVQIREAWGGRALVLVLDQLERALLSGADAGARRAILTLLSGVGRQTQGRRVVVGIREDFLGRLLREAHLPVGDQGSATSSAGETAAAIITAGPLTEAESRDAITLPLEGTGVSLDSELLTRVLLPALLQERGAAPSRLQIVCGRLYEAARADRRKMDLRLYEQLGGAEEILGTYLDQALTSGRYDGEEAQARAMLKAMTGPEVRRWAGLGELWQRLAQEELATDEVQLRSLLSRLMDDRLVVSRGGGPAAPTRYSLMHDQLAGVVRGWRSAAELERQEAQDRLDRALAYYAEDGQSGELLGGYGLRLVERHLPRLRRDDMAAELVAASRRGRRLRRLSVALLLGVALLGVVFGVVQLRGAVRQRDNSARLADQGVMLHARQDLARDPTRAVAWLRNLSQPTSGIAGLALLEAARRQGVARVLTGHRDVVSSVTFSPDGKLLASGGRDGAVHLFAVPSARRLRQLGRHGAEVQAVAFSPDGKTVAAGGRDGVVWLHGVQPGAAPRALGQAGGGVDAVVFSPDGKLLAWAGEDPHVTLWSLAQNRVARRLQKGEAQGRTLSLAISPDGLLVMAGGATGQVSRWPLGAEHEAGIHARGHDAGVYALAFSPDGTALASAGLDQRVVLWDSRLNVDGLPRVVALPQRTLALAYTPDGRALALAGAGKEVRFVRPGDGSPLVGAPPLRGHLGAIHDLAISRDGRFLATASRDNTIRLYDLHARARDPQAAHTQLKGHSKEVWDAAFTPDGRSLVSTGKDGQLHGWGLAGGRKPQESWTHGGEAFALAVSPDGRSLISAGWGGEVRRFARDRAGTPVASARVASGAVYAVAYAPGGGEVALAGSDGQVRFLSAETLSPLAGRQPLAHPEAVLSLLYLPGQGGLVTGCRDGLVRVWTPGQARLKGRPLKGHEAAIYSLALSPDGRQLASGAGDATIRLWQLSAQRPQGKPLSGHHGWVLSLAYAPDGRTLASGSSDGTIRFWDTRAHRLLGPPLRGHKDWVHAVTYAPDGQILASGGADGQLWLWRLYPARLPMLRQRVDAMTNLNVSPHGRVSYRQ